MTLFTAEGLIAAALSGAQGPERIGLHLYRSYRRWLATQELSRPPDTAQTWLERQAWLYDRRAPGNACLSGLAGPAMGTGSVRGFGSRKARSRVGQAMGSGSRPVLTSK
jgi:hypothetical protein